VPVLEWIVRWTGSAGITRYGLRIGCRVSGLTLLQLGLYSANLDNIAGA
jgi:hypothetical protein